MGRLLKTFGIYFAGTALNRLMGFVVTAIATHAVNPSDFGYYNTAQTAVNIILTLVSLQAWMAVIRFVFDYESKKYKRKVIATGYFIEAIAFLIYTVGFVIFCLLFNVRDAVELYILSLGYVFVQSTQFACRGLGKNKLYVYSGAFGSLMQLIFSIVFIFGFGMNSSGLILAMAMSYWGQGLFIEFFLKSIRRFRLKDVDLKLGKSMIKYSIPTAINQSIVWVNQSANIFIIGLCINQSAVGMFSAAFRMNSLIGFIIMAFNLAFQEFSFSLAKSEKRGKMYNFMFNAYIRFISCGMMFLLPVTSVLFSFMIGPSYSAAKVLIPLLYVGSFFESLQIFLSSIMQAEKRVNLMFISQLVGAILTVGIMFLTIGHIGLQSAGLAMVICFATVSLIRIIGIRSQIRLKFRWSYFIHYAAVFGLTVFVFLNYSELVNFLYAIPLALYCLFCLRKVIKMFISQILGKKKA